MSIEAMKQALEALEELVLLFDRTRESECLPMQLVRANAAQKILRAAIAEASMQRLTDVQQEMEHRTRYHLEDGTPLYTHPPRREWVGLTDEEIDSRAQQDGMTPFKAPSWFVELCRDIEAKLEEKNS